MGNLTEEQLKNEIKNLESIIETKESIEQILREHLDTKDEIIRLKDEWIDMIDTEKLRLKNQILKDKLI